jgi:long-chain acyl-CoA synthetase
VTIDLAPSDRYAAIASEWTIPALLHRNATEYPDQSALTAFGSPDRSVSWRELRDQVAALSRGLAGLGLAPGDRMLISSSSRIEHWLADLAAVHLGAVPCTAYATLSTEQLGYLARHSAAPVIVVEAGAQLARWRPILAELLRSGEAELLPALRHVVVIDGDDEADPPLLSFAEVMRSGAAAHEADPGAFERGWRAVRSEQPVTLLYTSGTTGDPKGVVLSHRNVIYQCVVVEALLDVPPHPRSVAYLPLAHVAERILGIYNPIYRAGHATICADPADLVPALQAVRPVSLFGVPRVWEKIAAGVQTQLAGADAPVRDAVAAAGALAREVFELRAAQLPVPDELAARLAAIDAAVLRPIRARLGLDEVAWAGTGAAPIPVAVLYFLAGLGLDVLEVWGMTETTGTVTINTHDRFRPGTVGRPNPGMEVRIAEDGEILVRGPLVATGYLRADGTVESIVDDDGWLATGDVGQLDPDGFLTITDRKKELIITSAGKNIAPSQIENLLRAHPLIAQAVAIGDRRPYVTALIVLDEEVVPQWAAARGVPAGPLAELAADPLVRAEIEAAVAAANERLSRPEQVKRFRILPTGWTPDSGELTPTLKLRRRIIVDRYAADIDTLYGTPEA